ncbi:MAG: hypothetical protein ACFFE1_17850 [Candidatus Thorarchaeota archaeon]
MMAVFIYFPMNALGAMGENVVLEFKEETTGCIITVIGLGIA